MAYQGSHERTRPLQRRLFPILVTPITVCIVRSVPARSCWIRQGYYTVVRPLGHGISNAFVRLLIGGGGALDCLEVRWLHRESLAGQPQPRAAHGRFGQQRLSIAAAFSSQPRTDHRQLSAEDQQLEPFHGLQLALSTVSVVERSCIGGSLAKALDASHQH